MKRLIFAAAALALPLTVVQTAQAGIESCGNIDVRANAKCEVVVEGGCTAKCTPVSFTAACSAELYASCDASCPQLPSVECTGSCSGTCQADCMANANFDCTTACKADCDGDCSAKCADEGDKTKCDASCKATCDAECNTSCEGTANANCEAQCQGCCQGSCTADARLECQIDCQATGYVDCEARLQGGCQAECQKPEGALFCDGQYVDVGNNLEDCIAALQAELNIKVTGYADGSCDDNGCEGEAGGSVSCAASPAQNKAAGGAVAFAVAIMGAAFLTRRRRQ